jgi:hypothetical protein
MDEKDNKTEAATDADEQYFVLIECRNEEQQVELLKRFLLEGLKCRALLG